MCEIMHYRKLGLCGNNYAACLSGVSVRMSCVAAGVFTILHAGDFPASKFGVVFFFGFVNHVKYLSALRLRAYVRLGFTLTLLMT